MRSGTCMVQNAIAATSAATTNETAARTLGNSAGITRLRHANSVKK